MSKAGETRAKRPFELSQPPILDETVRYEEDDDE
jgi:hypothetical protein